MRSPGLSPSSSRKRVCATRTSAAGGEVGPGLAPQLLEEGGGGAAPLGGGGGGSAARGGIGQRHPLLRAAVHRVGELDALDAVIVGGLHRDGHFLDSRHL